VVEITDEGPGIAPEVLRHLFEPFRTTKTNGTGLGLNISQQIMARHGGTITVAATGPQGTTFRLEFPLHPSTSGDLHVQG
jgi:signal transduction histidine kinase